MDICFAVFQDMWKRRTYPASCVCRGASKHISLPRKCYSSMDRTVSKTLRGMAITGETAKVKA